MRYRLNDRFADPFGFQGSVFAHHIFKAFFAEHLAICIARFKNTIGGQQHNLAGLYRPAVILICPVRTDTQCHTGTGQLIKLIGGRTVKEGRIMAGPDPGDVVVLWRNHQVKQGHELSGFGRIHGCQLVDAIDDFSGGAG